MRLRVTLASDGSVSELEPPGPYVVGRANDAQIRIGDVRVSRRHAVLSFSDGAWHYDDAASRGGSWKAGERVGAISVREAIGIRLGAGDGPELELEPVLAEDDEVVGATPRRDSSSALSTVQCIGRADDNDLVLPELLVSRQHAVLTVDKYRSVLADLDTHNGTFVNGRRITQQPLTDSDRVTIGSTCLVLAEGRLVRAEQDHAALEASNLTVTAGDEVILDGVGLAIPPGTFMAILGPTGAGKSTLVKALTGVRPPDAGHVLVDGRDLYENFEELRLSLGYVPQDDILHQQLAVRTALRFGAELRFSPDTDPLEREQRVEEVLRDLGLIPRGDLAINKLSGGQRKRTNVALELLTKPSLLLLDEPTSGLDPGYEQTVMEMLRELADADCTVIVVTHSLASLALCDLVLVLAPGGRTAYQGPPAGLLGHFDAPDYASVFRQLEAETRAIPREAEQRDTTAPPQTATPEGSSTQPPPVDWRRQLSTLIRRHFAILAADRRNIVVLLAAAVVPALLVLLLVAGAALAADGPIPRDGSRELVAALVVTATALGAANGLREIVKEQPIYQRERAVGVSRIVYLASKVLALGGVTAVQCTVLVLIGTAAAGGPQTSNFLPPHLELILDVVLTGLAGLTLGLLISAFVSTSEKAMALIPIVFVVSWLFAGVSVDLQRRPVMRGISYAVTANWGVSATASSVDLPELIGCDSNSTAADPAATDSDSRPDTDFVCDANWRHGFGYWFTNLIGLLFLASAFLLAADWALARREPTVTQRRGFVVAVMAQRLRAYARR